MFNGRIYEQSFSLPIGSPLSPLLSTFFMDAFEENFKMSPRQPTVIIRHRDDDFTNEMDEKVIFSMGVEENGHVSRLDVEVIRSEETLKKKLFKKNSNVGITLNFQSNHNYGMKIGILLSMMIRSLRPTDSEF
ncbi:unnamed protein product [Protopolystoma xenopodis]|uniref:Reverse transcriptase domain-containing protein n=1 Tax=Protopolystoma xenopodis TaxID=117903 RepID=A0A448WPP1_9PLAT|nr:unnamed protein product [Protopolystoma xenopodis]